MFSIPIVRFVSLACVALLVGSASGSINPAQSIQRVATLRTARAAHTATVLRSGQVLVAGGMADGGDGLASAELYDPRTATFDRGPSMANRRYKIAGTSVLLPDGNMLVTSGARAAELLDITSWTFREVPGRLPEAYRFAAAAPLRGGEVLITGGYSDANQNTAGVWRFRQQ
ncbi:MAG TPA: kelch repeat-containing protein [Gemmatimonadaceae bacterium]